MQMVVKNLPAKAGDMRHGFYPMDGKIPLEEDMATHSSIVAWRIPWTEEIDRLQFHGVTEELAVTETPVLWPPHAKT